MNSFGYGGTNAHAIMEDYASYVASSNRVGCGECLPEKAQTNGDQQFQPNRSRVISLSGKDERAAEAMIEALRNYLTTSMGGKDEDRLLDDLAYTLSRGRTKFPCSASLHVTSVSDLMSGLSPKNMKPVKSNRVPRLGFGESSLSLWNKHGYFKQLKHQQCSPARVLSGLGWAGNLSRATQSTRRP